MAGAALHKLKARQVETAGEGEYADGGGLVLRVGATGHRAWQFVWKRGARGEAKRVRIALGRYPDLSLADARAKAAEYRAELAAGREPAAPASARPATSSAKVDEQGPETFGYWMERLHAQLAGELANAKHHAQWRSTLTEYAGSLFPRPLSDITRTDVVELIKPIWHRIPETAQRTLGRIARVFDYAAAHDAFGGSNPAQWGAAMRQRLGPRRKLSRGNHPAMPYQEVPAFMQKLSASKGTGARALAFLILTGARSGEVRGATWGEIDREAAVWTVPAERMKAKKEHRVPLPPAALAVIGEPGDDDVLIFPGAKPGRPLSNDTLGKLMEDQDAGEYVPHGFRTSFRMWAQETGVPYEVAERCLAHEVGNKVARAYARSDMLAQRRPVMEAWAAHLKPH